MAAPTQDLSELPIHELKIISDARCDLINPAVIEILSKDDYLGRRERILQMELENSIENNKMYQELHDDVRRTTLITRVVVSGLALYSIRLGTASRIASPLYLNPIQRLLLNNKHEIYADFVDETLSKMMTVFIVMDMFRLISS